MTYPKAGPATNFSKDLSGASEQLFPEVLWNTISERFIFNASAGEDLWFNPFGGEAAFTTAGSIKLAPGEGWSGAITSQINVIGTAGEPVTAGQRVVA